MGKRILITFDYELFLGRRSGKVECCLIQPTEKLLRSFDIHGAKPAIFFIDTTYLLQLEEKAGIYPRVHRDYQTIRLQLIDILKKGHLLLPHLHPHWMDAGYDPDKNEWSLTDYRNYRFHNLPEEERMNIFAGSIRILEEIQKEAGISHPIDGFRAGGWSLMPFADFHRLFQKHHIRYDFSAISRSVAHTLAQDYDYSTISGNQWYAYDQEVTIPVKDGNFIEHPVSILPPSSLRDSLDRFWRKVNWKLGYRSMGDGEGVEAGNIEIERECSEACAAQYLGIENLTQGTYGAYKQYIREHDYIHFLSHPKMVSRINLYYWNHLLRWIQKNDTVNYRYQVPEIKSPQETPGLLKMDNG